jgi:hypothetical protein
MIMKNDFFLRLLCLLFPSVIFIGGCASDIKDSEIKGAWLGRHNKNLFVVGNDCLISVWNPKTPLMSRPKTHRKYEYKVIREKGAWLKINAWTCQVKRDSDGLYLDGTPYWLGFIPMDNFAIVRKISDKKALEILRERGVTKEEIEKLPLIKINRKYTTEPSSSYPKILDKL